MRFNRFIDKIQSNSLAIAKKWAKVVYEHEHTKTYHKLPEDQLVTRGKSVYDNLGKWLSPETPRAEIGKIYSDIGARRYDQGYPLCEIHYAIHFTKKVLVNYIRTESLLPDTLSLYQLHDFMLEIYDFFDIAAFYVTRGFQEALFKKIMSDKNIDKEKMNDIFPAGSFYYQREPESRSIERTLEGFNLFKVK